MANTFLRTVKPTLTPFLLNPGDNLRLTLSSGRTWEMTLIGASAEVVARGFDRYHDFIWRIIEQGGTYLIDPWILFHEIWAGRTA